MYHQPLRKKEVVGGWHVCETPHPTVEPGTRGGLTLRWHEWAMTRDTRRNDDYEIEHTQGRTHRACEQTIRWPDHELVARMPSITQEAIRKFFREQEAQEAERQAQEEAKKRASIREARSDRRDDNGFSIPGVYGSAGRGHWYLSPEDKEQYSFFDIRERVAKDEPIRVTQTVDGDWVLAPGEAKRLMEKK